MGVSRFALTYVAPPPGVAGMRCGDWLRAIGRYGFDARFAVRAGLTTGLSVANSVGGAVERAVWGRRIAREVFPAPVFVLGHGRSGTTLLHRLLSLDDRFVAPMAHEVLFPHTMLTFGGVARVGLGVVLPRTRPMDGMTYGATSVEEEEIGVGVLAGWGPLAGRTFGRFGDWEMVDLDRTSEAVIEAWSDAMGLFLRKLSIRRGGGVPLLKAPLHLARVSLLRRLFPGARFVHIHREPSDLMRSRLHLFDRLSFLRLRERDMVLEEFLVEQFGLVSRAFLAAREGLGEGELVEISYEDLVGDPVGVLRGVYGGLSLGGFEGVEGRLKDEARRMASYRRNVHEPVCGAFMERVRASCPAWFEAYGYGAPGTSGAGVSVASSETGAVGR